MVPLFALYYAIWSILINNCQCLSEEEMSNLIEYRINRTGRDLIVVVWTLIFLLLTIYKFYRNRDEIEGRLTATHYLSIIVMLCIFTAFSCRAIESFYRNTTLLVIIYYLFAQSGMTFLYILVLLRLYHTFKDTEYRLSKKALIIHPIILTISNLLTFASSGFDYLDLYPFNFIFISAATIIYMSGLSHLSYHFSNSLFSCVIHVDEKKAQQRFLKIIVKQTILVYWIDFAGFILAVTNVSTLLIDLNRDSLIFVLIRLQILAFANCVIILCVYLSFAVTESEYYCICKCCHNKCYSLYHSGASKLIFERKSTLTLTVMDRSSVTRTSEIDDVTPNSRPRRGLTLETVEEADNEDDDSENKGRDERAYTVDTITVNAQIMSDSEEDQAPETPEMDDCHISFDIIFVDSLTQF